MLILDVHITLIFLINIILLYICGFFPYDVCLSIPGANVKELSS